MSLSLSLSSVTCEYILYKQPIQYETLYIVQYLHSLGIHVIPKYCIERNYPLWVLECPSIHALTTDKKYIGLNACVLFYEEVSGITDLLQKSIQFKQLHPEYRIHP
jgi:hypothetical protein